MSIFLAFVISVVPVFIFYMLSVFEIRTPPVLQLVVWWLLVSGAFLNLVIYSVMNEKMKRSIRYGAKFVAFKMKCGADPREAAAQPTDPQSSSSTKISKVTSSSSRA